MAVFLVTSPTTKNYPLSNLSCGRNTNKLHNQQASTMVADGILLNDIPNITYVSPINYQQKHPILKHLLTSHGRASPSTGYRWLPLNRHCRRLWPQSGCLAHITSRQCKARREKIKIHSSKTEWSIRIYIYNTYINRICVCMYIYIYDYICIHGQTCRYQLPTLLRLYLGLVLGFQRHSQKVFGAQEIQYTCTCVCVYVYHMHVCLHLLYEHICILHVYALHIHIHIYTYRDVHMYIYIYIHTYMIYNIHIHIQI